MKHLFKLSALAFVAVASLLAAPLAPAAAAVPEKAAALPVEQISSENMQTPSAFLLFSAAPFLLGGILNVRSLKDLNLQCVVTLAAAGATSYSPVLDTASVNPGRVAGFDLLFELPATPNLVDAKTVTLTLQDSADGVTFANVTDIPAQVVTGAGGVGAAKFSYQTKPPITLRRFIRLRDDVLAAAGNNTAISATLSFVF